MSNLRYTLLVYDEDDDSVRHFFGNNFDTRFERVYETIHFNHFDMLKTFVAEKERSNGELEMNSVPLNLEMVDEKLPEGSPVRPVPFLVHRSPTEVPTVDLEGLEERKPELVENGNSDDVIDVLNEAGDQEMKSARLNLEKVDEKLAEGSRVSVPKQVLRRSGRHQTQGNTRIQKRGPNMPKRKPAKYKDVQDYLRTLNIPLARNKVPVLTQEQKQKAKHLLMASVENGHLINDENIDEYLKKAITSGLINEYYGPQGTRKKIKR